jgi:hypothetical protein
MITHKQENKHKAKERQKVRKRNENKFLINILFDCAQIHFRVTFLHKNLTD